MIVGKRTFVISPLEIFSLKAQKKKKTHWQTVSSILMYFLAHTLNVVERVRVYQDYVTNTEHSKGSVYDDGRQAVAMAAE